MADFVFNVSKGKVRYYNDQAQSTADDLIAILLKTSGLEADDTLNNATSITSLVSGATDEATDGSYPRKTLTPSVSSQDDTNNWVLLDTADITWTALAGAAISKLVICYKPSGGNDGTTIPVSCHDFAVTPDGTDVTATVTNYIKIT